MHLVKGRAEWFAADALAVMSQQLLRYYIWETGLTACNGDISCTLLSCALQLSMLSLLHAKLLVITPQTFFFG